MSDISCVPSFGQHRDGDEASDLFSRLIRLADGCNDFSDGFCVVVPFALFGFGECAAVDSYRDRFSALLVRELRACLTEFCDVTF